MKLPPAWAWPQFGVSFTPGLWVAPKATKDFGYLSVDLGPLGFEIDGREYVKWITDVVLPEGKMMRDWPGSDEPDDEPRVPGPVTIRVPIEVAVVDEEAEAALRRAINKAQGFVHTATCPCRNKLA